jgi:maltose O-acetyltransferase
MLAGDLYIADGPQLAADSLRARRLLDRYNGAPADAGEERRRLLEQLLSTFGPGSELRPPLLRPAATYLVAGAEFEPATFGL